VLAGMKRRRRKGAFIRNIVEDAMITNIDHTADVLAGMWKDLLGLPTVCPTDTFVALGGHSLMAMELAARIAETFHVDVPFDTLLNDDDFSALVSLVSEAIPRDEDGTETIDAGEVGDV
jgi:acyl carrier protein